MIKEFLDYDFGDGVAEGYLSYSGGAGKKPCVLVCHAWGGQSQAEREIADRIAELGYVVFAIDVYGKGVRGDPFVGNEHLMQPLLDDRALLRQRLLSAVRTVQGLEMVDAQRIGVIGYCFGGLCALDLARSCCEPVRAAVSFHGALSSPGLDQHPMSTKVLILHGYEDPVAPQEAMIGIANELTQARADWQIHAYGHTKHAFTAPQANLPEAGIMYHPASARRAWSAMTAFLEEALGPDETE